MLAFLLGMQAAGGWRRGEAWERMRARWFAVVAEICDEVRGGLEIGNRCAFAHEIHGVWVSCQLKNTISHQKDS